MNPIYRELAHVPRWAIVRTNRQQSVAEHAFFVARYAIDICRELGINPRPEFIEYCLKHDDEELYSGDIPAPYKKMRGWNSEKPKCLLDVEWMILKAADLLESILFLIDEQLLGNKTVNRVLVALLHELQDLTGKYMASDNNTLGYWLAIRIDAHRTYGGRVA